MDHNLLVNLIRAEIVRTAYCTAPNKARVFLDRTPEALARLFEGLLPAARDEKREQSPE